MDKYTPYSCYCGAGEMRWTGSTHYCDECGYDTCEDIEQNYQEKENLDG